jgi:hypothetical protein
MNPKSRGIGDNEVVSITVTGKELRYIHASVAYTLELSSFKDYNDYTFLEKIKARLHSYLPK